MDREPQPISLQLGTEDEWIITLAAEDGATLSPYTSGDAVACVVGQGPGLPQLFAPTVAWIDPVTLFTLSLAIAPGDTSGLDPGTYPIDVYVTRTADSKRRCVWSGWLELAPGALPGGTAGATYAAAQDMLDICGDWLSSLRPKYSQANFLRARVRARQWLDKAILAHVPPTVGQRGDLLYGLNLFGPQQGYSQQVAAYLSSDFLLVTDATVEMVSTKAIAIVCQDQLGSEDPDPWPGRAAFYHREAARLAKGYVAEIDVNGDGAPDFAFSLAFFKMRRD